MQKKSCKGNACIAYEEILIKEIDPSQDTSRSGIFNRAIKSAINITDEEWDSLRKELKLFKNHLPKGINVPTVLQVKVSEELENDLMVIESNIKRVLELSVFQTRYEMELLLFNYLEYLKAEVMNVGEKKNITEMDLSGPDMVKRLVQMLLLNREADKNAIEKIKNILLEWEE